MTDIYESRVIELAAEIDYINKDPYGAVLPEDIQHKFDELKRLAKECLNVKRIRKLKVELLDSHISWITTELKDKYEARIAKICSRYGSQAEKVFFNIVYCILSRCEIRAQCDQRLRLVSYDMFCKRIARDRHTLARQCTVHITVPLIQTIWFTDTSDNPNPILRTVIFDIFKDFAGKILN